MSETLRNAMQPLDGRIAEGLFFDDSVASEWQLFALKHAINQAFDDSREQDDGEFGRCLAYTIGVSEEITQPIDEALLEVAATQNHGMRPFDISAALPGRPILWAGRDASGRGFAITKAATEIMLSDNSHPEGVVYALKSCRVR